MAYAILGLAALVLLLLSVNWFVKANPAKLAVQLKLTAGWTLLILAVVFAIYRQWYLSFALGGIGFTLLGFGRRGGGFSAGAKSSGQTSKVRSEKFEMELDHDSGQLSGRIISGKFEGYELEQLSMDQMKELWMECQSDEQNRALLEAYLDHRDSEWRSQFGQQGSEGRQPSGDTPMSREEAYDILGLEPGAGEKEIRAAHKRLIAKVHPDLGGSNFLAAKINQAKDLLLGQS